LRSHVKGFTILELMMAMVIVAIMFSLAMMAYQNYETRTRVMGAAQVLVMDVRLQQQRARTLDESQGILFSDKHHYSLGRCDDWSNTLTFHRSYPPREVDMQQSFSGVFIDTLKKNGVPMSFPVAIKLDPSATDGAGRWVPFSGDVVEVVLKGRTVTYTVNVQAGGDVVLSGRQ